MIDERGVAAIVLAAGDSRRYGKSRNKNFELINGKEVLAYSLNVFDKNGYVDDIIVTIKNDEVYLLEKLLQELNLSKNVYVVIGGNTRQESVYNAISDTNRDIVIIHDGARPLIRDSYVSNCIEEMRYFKGVTVGVKSKDTVKITNDNNLVVNTTNRNNTWIVQTPQCFDREILLSMHNEYKNDLVTDDCSLLEKRWL